MPDSALARLSTLEARARALEPDAATRAALARAALAHAEGLLQNAPAKAYRADAGSAAALATLPIGSRPAGLPLALAFMSQHVDFRGHTTWAPGFFGYVPGGNLYHAAVADFVAAVANPFTGHVVASPGGVQIENQLIAWLASLVGYPENAAGSLTSGGSLANLSAIITARQAAEIAARDVEQAVVYLTAHAHHCVTKGLRIAGLGECAVRHIQMDDHHRMRPGALDAEMTTDAHAGLRPWLVVASAGTTDTGAVDPLEPIADIAARHRAWFHVDAAYGGMFALCEEGKRRLAGIERSDSVVLDPHKGMLVPFGVGAVLVKDGPALAAAHAFDAHYAPPKAETRQERSPTELSVELSRPFRGLHLWLPLQILGTAPFEAALEEKLLLARYAYEKIRELEGVEVGPEPDLSIFIFRAIPKAGDADAFNLAIERALLDDGRILLSSTVVGGRRYLRFAVLALQTHREAVDRAVELISEKMRALGSAPARC